ncbi:MAG: carboxylating nicotinate-nucleotide diphosphorylase [Actinomycetota bacterium]
MDLAEQYLTKIVETAINEDLGLAGDITSQAIMPDDRPGSAVIIAKQNGVVAGLFAAEAVFKRIDPSLFYEDAVTDGAVVEPGQIVARVDGNLLSILTGERVALNFLGHLSGIATLTSRYVTKASAYGVDVKDTRKTLPGLRPLEKYAVLVGGGKNHRFGLYDAVLIKENHIKTAGGVTEAIDLIRKNLEGDLAIEIETETLEQVKEAIEAGADTIMLDNMDAEMIAEAVKAIDGQATVEVSGGVNLDNIEDIAKAGPDFISVGGITQSAPAFDFSLLTTRR